MTILPGHFHHDASNRLTYEIYALESDRYATICDRIVNSFDLSPAGELVIGLDEMLRDYTDGRNVIGLNGITGRVSLLWPRMQAPRP